MGTLIKADFYDNFACTAENCPNNCCHGWRITIDKDTFSKYRRLKGPMGKKINSFVHRDRNNKNNFNNYAKIRLDKSGNCPFLSDKKTCTVHSSLGHNYLSHTCQIYPRLETTVNNIKDLNLSISCPEVVKLAIMNKNKIKFKIEENINISSTETSSFDTLNVYFRNIAIAVMQADEIELWKRITIILMIAEALQEDINNNDIPKAEKTLEEYLISIENGVLIDSIDEVKENSPFKFTIVNTLLTYNLSLNGYNKEFRNCCIDFNTLLEKEPTLEDKIEKFRNLSKEHFDKFLKENPNIFENYLVYHIFRFFRKASANKDIYGEAVKMVINYSIIRALLLPIIINGSKEEDLIKVFYSFSRSVEHNDSFMGNVYDEAKSTGFYKLSNIISLVV